MGIVGIAGIGSGTRTELHIGPDTERQPLLRWVLAPPLAECNTDPPREVHSWRTPFSVRLRRLK